MKQIFFLKCKVYMQEVSVHTEPVFHVLIQ